MACRSTRSRARRPARVAFTDTGLPAGSTHTYQVDAVDAATNASLLSDTSGPITVLAPDMTPPGDPGIPTGVSNSTSTIDLIWAASIDNVSTDLTYHVFRDGQDAQHQVAQFTSSAGTLTFTDTGLWPGSSHTYYVEAVDEAGNEGNQVASAPITVMAAVFADDFSGGLVELEHGHQDHARRRDRLVVSAERTGESRARARSRTQTCRRRSTTVCVSANVNVSNRTTALDLIRLRTAANGAVGRVFLTHRAG